MKSRMAGADGSSPRQSREGFESPGSYRLPSSIPESRVIVRPPLTAALAFVEAARAKVLDVDGLARWVDKHLVEPGLMIKPTTVQEQGHGAVLLAPAAGTESSAARARRIVATAYERVTTQLAGLLLRPADDRFLSAAIFSRRVERIGGPAGTGWRACPQPTDRLSGIVLSLFAADVLAHREEYDAGLNVCEVCGKVSLVPDAPPSVRTLGREIARVRCNEHPG
jgi:hypothetical protein